VLGRDTGRWPRPWRVTLAEAVGVLGNDLDVIQIALPAREPGKRRPAPVPADESQAAPGGPPASRAYLMSAATCGVVALLAAPLHSVFELSNIVMMFLLAVVFVAVRFGRGPAVLAAFLSVAAFDFLYVPPRFTFSINDAQYLVTFAVMLVVRIRGGVEKDVDALACGVRDDRAL
jgi:two-component system sensor histidine kinase KdpD